MFDPRIYRAGFLPVALAVIALAFSLSDQQGPLGTNLASDAFNGQHAFAQLNSLASAYPSRHPGSFGDDALADRTAQVFSANGFSVTRNLQSARTADGTKTLDTVIGVRTGFSSRRVVVVAHRDSLASPSKADLSGTVTLLDLSHVLSERTLNRTIVLASISGSAGGAGAAQLAGMLRGQVDAVIVLGDMAGTQIRAPIVVPWSNGQAIAPPTLRNTVAAAIGSQAAQPSPGTSLPGQLARLAMPLSLTEQGPFLARGEPSVLLSASGERGPAADAIVTPDRLTGFGRAALQTVTALDGGATIPPPSTYLVMGNKLIPAWAVRLLVLTLMFPALGAAIDGLARARRRGHAVGMSIARVLAAALPFATAAGLVVALRETGLLKVAPPGPVGAGVVPLHAAGVAVLIGGLCVAALTAAVVWRFVAGLGASTGRRGSNSSASDGGAVAVVLVMCVTALVVWAVNPFAAGLLVLALHLWMWAGSSQARPRSVATVTMILAGLVPIVLVVAYYAIVFGLGPIDLTWNAALLVAGNPLGTLLAVGAASTVLGCAVSVAVIAANAEAPEELMVTVRGPVTYAGPGSLGGTESALRR
jgi:hypothetical protein